MRLLVTKMKDILCSSDMHLIRAALTRELIRLIGKNNSSEYDNCSLLKLKFV